MRESTGLSSEGWRRIEELKRDGQLHEAGLAEVFFEEDSLEPVPVPGARNGPSHVLVIGLFDGMGCLRIAAERMGLKVIGYISSEIDRSAKRLVRLRWPGVVEWNDISQVDRDVVERTLLSFAGLVSVVWIGAGIPCQDLSGYNKSGKDHLIGHVPRIIHLVHESLKVPIVWMVENVASMSTPNLSSISSLLGVKPYKACASDLHEVARSRYYWFSYKLSSCDYLEIVEKAIVL